MWNCAACLCRPCCRRERGDSGQPVTIMVEGVQVTLPSYEEAVSGAGGTVLPRLLPQTQLESMEHLLTQTSSTHTQHTEISVVHQPSSSSSFSSAWSLDGAQGATAASSALQCQNSDSSQQNSVLSLHGSEQDLADGTNSLCFSTVYLTFTFMPFQLFSVSSWFKKKSAFLESDWSDVNVTARISVQKQSKGLFTVCWRPWSDALTHL